MPTDKGWRFFATIRKPDFQTLHRETDTRSALLAWLDAPCNTSRYVDHHDRSERSRRAEHDRRTPSRGGPPSCGISIDTFRLFGIYFMYVVRLE